MFNVLYLCHSALAVAVHEPWLCGKERENNGRMAGRDRDILLNMFVHSLLAEIPIPQIARDK
jgi:hypothetical protein